MDTCDLGDVSTIDGFFELLQPVWRVHRTKDGKQRDETWKTGTVDTNNRNNRKAQDDSTI